MKVCEPCERFESACGVVHAEKTEPSSWHSKVAAGSFEERDFGAVEAADIAQESAPPFARLIGRLDNPSNEGTAYPVRVIVRP